MLLFNISPSPEIVGGAHNPAISPGDGYDFDEETAEYLLNTGRWSEQDPRAGIAAEVRFKQDRDTQTPAVPDNQGAAE
jgi:hypothetical protein